MYLLLLFLIYESVKKDVDNHILKHSFYRFDFYIAKVLNPPSTTATVPVTNLAASLIK